jgi:hypothetical protein
MAQLLQVVKVIGRRKLRCSVNVRHNAPGAIRHLLAIVEVSDVDVELIEIITDVFLPDRKLSVPIDQIELDVI